LYFEKLIVIVFLVSLTLGVPRVLDIYNYEVEAKIVSSTPVTYGGKSKLSYRVYDRNSKSVMSFVNGIEGIDWPNNLKKHDKISKNKESFLYCINADCNRTPLWSQVVSILWWPGGLFVVYLLALGISAFNVYRKTI